MAEAARVGVAISEAANSAKRCHQRSRQQREAPPSAIRHLPSAISHQPSAIRHQPSLSCPHQLNVI